MRTLHGRAELPWLCVKQEPRCAAVSRGGCPGRRAVLLLSVFAGVGCMLDFARSAEKDGISYHALIARIVELASARYAR